MHSPSGYADVSIVFIVFVSLRPFMRLGVRASASTLSKRWSSVSSVVSEDVPRLSELKTIRELLRAHDEHGLSFRAREVSACWNALGRLVRDDPVQRAWLQQALAQGPELQPLVDTTLHRLPHMNATPVALTAHGVSMVAAYTTFVPSKSILRSMSRRSIRCMEHPVHGPATPPLALSVIAYAFARLKVPSHELFATIAHTAGEKLPEFQARNLSNMCWAFAMADFESKAEFFSKAASVAAARFHDFNAQECSNVLWAFGKSGHASPELFDAFASHALATDVLVKFPPQSLANTAWAYATLGHESPRLFDAIADASLRRIAKFKPQELSALLFAYAKLMHAAPQLLDAIAREGAERIEELEPRSISKMLYSYGKLGHSAPTFFAAAATAASAQMERFNAQELSNLLHGIAKAGVRQADAPLLLDAAVTSVLERIDELSPQDLASISWSLTTSGVRGERALALYASISSRFTRWLPDLSNHDVATAAWAFGDGGAGAGEAGGDRVYRAASLFDAISLHSLPRLPAFTASELSMLCYAFSAAGHPAPVLFDTIGKEAASRLDEFGLVEMVGLVCSHAHAGLTSPELFAAVADCAPELIVSGGVDMSRQWSRLAWAFATAGDGSRKVFDTITSEAAARVDEIDDADLIRIAWSCAVVDYGAESLFGTPRVVERWARRAAQGKLSEATQLMQLHQWQLWLEERDSPWPRLPAPLAERCLSVSLELEPSRSALQGEVSAALRELLSLPTAEEVRTEHGVMLDAVVTCEDGTEVAIEVDGPSHYLKSAVQPGRSSPSTGEQPRRSLNGGTLLKHRQLRATGWPLLAVPYFEWQELGSDEERRVYLERGLQQARRRAHTPPPGERGASHAAASHTAC